MKLRVLSVVFLFLITSAAVHGRSFYAAEQHVFSVFPEGSATADFDGDGSLDLVVLYRGDGNFPLGASVLFGGGTAPDLFTQDDLVYTVGWVPVDIVAGDLDGDGDADFAALRKATGGGSNTTELELYLNNGTGGFAPGPALTTTTGDPVQAIAVELNGDAQADLAVIHNDGNSATAGTLTIWLSDGSGGFVAATSRAVGELPNDLEAADVDGGSGSDLLVVADGPSPKVEILFNDGSGGIGGTFRNVFTANEPSAVVAADFDGDTRLDLVITHREVQNSGHQGYSKIHSYLQTAAGTFNFQDEFDSGQCPIDVKAAHLDDDGLLDLVAILDNIGGCSWSAGTGVTFLQNPNFDGSNDAFLPGSNFVSGHKPQTLLVEDFNADGDDDIVVTNFGRKTDNHQNDTFETMSTVVNLSRDDDGDGAMQFQDILPILDGSADSQTLAGYQYSGPGGGSVVGDFNQDGYADLYLLRDNQSSGGNTIMLHAGDPLQFGPGGKPFLLHTGHGATAPGASNTGAVVADFNNDTWPDIYVTGSVGFSQIGDPCCASAGNCKVANPGEIARMQNFLYLNDGDPDQNGWDGTFTDVTTLTTSGVESVPAGGSNELVIRGNTRAVTAADFDRNGWIDIYVGNFFLNGGCDPNSCANCPSDNANYGMKNGLYLNQGVDAGGVLMDFVESSASAAALGTIASTAGGLSDGGSALGLFAADVDNDGWVDLYVANDMDLPDGSPLYKNRGNNSGGAWLGFSDKSVAFGIDIHTSNGMGCDIGDINGDGRLDFAVSDGMSTQGGNFGCVLYEQKVTTFQQPIGPIRKATTVVAVPLPPVIDFDPIDFPNVVGAGFGWQIGFEDFDLDGDEDLHISSTKNEMDMLYRNDGLDSEDRPILVNVGGRTLSTFHNTKAAAYADFDQDGWIDVWQVNPSDPARLFMNRTARVLPVLPNWLQVRALAKVTVNGNPVFRDAIGARVTVKADVDGDGSNETLVRVIQSGEGASGSTSEPWARFGLGVDTVVKVIVKWPNGTKTTFSGQASNQRLTVQQP